MKLIEHILRDIHDYNESLASANLQTEKLIACMEVNGVVLDALKPSRKSRRFPKGSHIVLQKNN